RSPVRGVDVAKLTIGVVTAVLVVVVAAVANYKMAGGFKKLEETVKQEAELRSQNKTRIDSEEDPVAEAKQGAKQRPKIVSVIPTAPPAATPQPSPTVKRGFLGLTL